MYIILIIRKAADIPKTTKSVVFIFILKLIKNMISFDIFKLAD